MKNGCDEMISGLDRERGRDQAQTRDDRKDGTKYVCEGKVRGDTNEGR